MKFYTQFHQDKSKFLITGYKDGRKFTETVNYRPYLFVNGEKNCTHKDIFGNPMGKVDFANVWEAKDFIKENRDIGGVILGGSDRFLYNYINDAYPGTIEYNFEHIKVGVIDIEVALPKEGGFPNIKEAKQEVTAITLWVKGKYNVFACIPFDPTDPLVAHLDIEYHQCKNEEELMRSFYRLWSEEGIDIYSGWNSNGFDLIYIYNRARRILGDEFAKRLSPWGMVELNFFTKFGKEQVELNIIGVSGLDYIDLYKRFSFKPQESYSLENIAQEELGVGKVDHSEYANINEFLEKNPQKFICYNIIDTAHVVAFEAKMKLIEMVVSFAYDSKINYNDTFTTVLPWDCAITNYLLEKNVVVPTVPKRTFNRNIMGGYVKDPIPGKYPWIVSFDANSLYPHIMMYLNLGPETYRGRREELSPEDFLSDNPPKPRAGYSLSAIGAEFDNSVQSFFSEMMEYLYERRAKAKDEMKVWKKKLEGCDPADKKMIEAQISTLNNIQHNSKIRMNACFGAVANEGFRHNNADIAESITGTGQLIIQFGAREINRDLNKKFKTNNVDYIVYCDTDSIYINLKPLVDKYCEGKSYEDIVKFCRKISMEYLNPMIEGKMEELGRMLNAKKPDKIKFKLEKICMNSIFSAKKKYALYVADDEGVVYAKPKVKVTGLESVRSSTPKIAKGYIKEAFEIIMTKDQKDLQNFIEECRSEFLTKEFIDVAFPRGVSDLEQYMSKQTIYTKGTPIHVRGSLLYNDMLVKKGLDKKYPKIYSGEKIKFCYLKTPNPIGENVIATNSGSLPKEFGLDKFIDYETQFEKVFLQPIQNVIDSFGWSVEYRASLEDFFA